MAKVTLTITDVGGGVVASELLSDPPVVAGTPEDALTAAQRVGAVLQLIVKTMDSPTPPAPTDTDV